MENLAEALIPVFIFMPVALIIKIISDNNIRRKLIDKGMVDENVKYLFLKKQSSHPISNLKWGMILIGIGLPLLLKQIFPSVISDEGMIGMMFILAGLGFICYYVIAKKELELQDREE